MKEELDISVYVMAAEKMINMVFTIEQTMHFMEEYRIQADEEVKKVLIPIIEDMMKWINDN